MKNQDQLKIFLGASLHWLFSSWTLHNSLMCRLPPSTTASLHDASYAVPSRNLSGWDLGRYIPNFIAGLTSLEEL